MTLNGVMALILHYFAEFVYDVVVKKFTFAIYCLILLSLHEYPELFTHLLTYIHNFTMKLNCIVLTYSCYYLTGDVRLSNYRQRQASVYLRIGPGYR